MTNSHGTGKQTKFNILIPRAINTVTLCKTTSLTRNRRTRAQIRRTALVGFAVSTPSCPGGLSADPTDRSKASAGAQLMRFQLAGAAKRRGGDAANSPGRRDLGASKYPPRAKRAGARASSGPLPLSLSWAAGGNNRGGWSRQLERKASKHTFIDQIGRN